MLALAIHWHSGQSVLSPANSMGQWWQNDVSDEDKLRNTDDDDKF